MSFLRRGGRRRGRVATAATTIVALGAFQALAIVGAGTASAVTGCTFNPSTNAIQITIDPNETAGVAVETAADNLDAESPPGAILFDNNGAGFENGVLSTQCGSATNTLTTSITVLGSPSAAETFYIDNFSGGEFSTTITWAVDLGSNAAATADLFEIFGSDDTDDEVTLTDTTFDLNGGGGPLLGVEWAFILGDDGDDVIDGSALVNTILWGFGGLGDDWVAGGAQATLPFAFAPELLAGDAGTDTLSYATRTTSVVVDSAAGQAGHSANADCDVIDPGDEQDVIATFEIYETGSGNDCFISNALVQEGFIPGDGDDDVTGDANDTISWETSSALMTIDPANGEATGQGADTFDGPTNFIGSAFDDVLIWDAATTNTFVGGDGVDTVDASAETSAQVINLDTLDDGVPPLGPFAADSLENAIGGSGDDDLLGNDLRNVLTGNDGNDDLRGFGGNDTFFGGLGNDNFDGGDGADIVDFGASPAGIEADMLLGFASGEGDDSFSDPPEIVKGSAFKDDITGGGGANATNYRFTGRAGNDRLTGSGSNDVLKGGAGNDKLRGGPGDDTLKGGKGKDKGWGGPGVDFCKKIEKAKGCE